MMTVTVPLPEQVEKRLKRLSKVNFRLWMFIAQQDLWEEAWSFVGEYCPDYDELPFDNEW